MSIIQRIYSELERVQKKPAELARFLEVTTSQMSAWKTRDTDPPARYVTKICEFLNCSVEYLLTGNEKQAPGAGSPVVRDEYGEVNAETAHLTLARLRADQALTERIREVIREELKKAPTEHS